MDIGGYSHPKARKQHVCYICSTFIEVGETYTRCKGLWQGEWQNWCAHKICLAIEDASRDCCDDELSQLGWSELVELCTTEAHLCTFLERFPPEDEEQAKLAHFQAKHLGARQHA